MKTVVTEPICFVGVNGASLEIAGMGNPDETIREALKMARAVLAKYIEPDGPNDHQTVKQLFGILNDPAVIQALKRLSSPLGTERDGNTSATPLKQRRTTKIAAAPEQPIRPSTLAADDPFGCLCRDGQNACRDRGPLQGAPYFLSRVAATTPAGWRCRRPQVLIRC
jgi:hypothetical protein